MAKRELAPGFFRKPPDGWLSGRTFVSNRSTWQGEERRTGVYHDERASSYSAMMSGDFRVVVEGRPDHTFRDDRRIVPEWCLDVGAPSGKRWYRIRLKPQYGLMPKIGLPCKVDPADPSNIWIDWDAAYDEHVVAWEQHAAVKKEVDKRRGGVEGALSSVLSNPFARDITAEEEVLVEQAQADERARVSAVLEQYATSGMPAGFAPVSGDEVAEQERRRLDAERIFATGREVDATVVSNEPTGRTLANVPTHLITFELDDGSGLRRVEHEYVWGPRVAKRYKPGKSFRVRIDPQDPQQVTPAQ